MDLVLNTQAQHSVFVQSKVLYRGNNGQSVGYVHWEKTEVLCVAEKALGDWDALIFYGMDKCQKKKKIWLFLNDNSYIENHQDLWL